MSIDISFDKPFTIEDVEEKTSIKIEYKNGNFWMLKNESTVLINCYTHTQKDIEKMIQSGEDIQEIDGEMFITKEGEKFKLTLDKGKNNVVGSISQYGYNSLSEIMDELVITFQTRFITDEEEEILWREENLDVDKVYTDTTIKFGYKIENGIISKK